MCKKALSRNIRSSPKTETVTVKDARRPQLLKPRNCIRTPTADTWFFLAGAARVCSFNVSAAPAARTLIIKLAHRRVGTKPEPAPFIILMACPMLGLIN